MINWLKNLFAPRSVPEKPSFVKEREYVYVGDGMMEEVIKDPRTPLQKALDEVTIANATRFKEIHLQPFR